jgi:acetyl-CoA acetyltransferase
MQLEDLGFCRKGEGGKFVEQTDISIHGQLPVNTHGGQLSAGQAGIGGGCSHIVEAARQLREEAGQRQVKDPKIGVVTAIGGLAYGVNLVHNVVMVFGKEV